MANFVLFLVLIISWSFCGCATIKNYPTRSVDPWDEVDVLIAAYSLSGYVSLQNDSEKQRIYRNNLINTRILAIDLNFEKFQQDLMRENSLATLGPEWAIMGLTGASAVVPLAQTKTVLSAISSGIAGGKGSMDTNLFYKKTIVALITQMKADRSTIHVNISTKMSQPTDQYPLSAALIDLEEYYRAGTIPQAIISVSATAGATIKEQKEKLERIMTGKYVKDPAGERLLKYWKPDGKNVDKDNQTGLLAWMQKNGLEANIPNIPWFLQVIQFSSLRVKAVEDLQLK